MLYIHINTEGHTEGTATKLPKLWPNVHSILWDYPRWDCNPHSATEDLNSSMAPHSTHLKSKLAHVDRVDFILAETALIFDLILLPLRSLFTHLNTKHFCKVYPNILREKTSPCIWISFNLKKQTKGKLPYLKHKDPKCPKKSNDYKNTVIYFKWRV